ncbi:MAG: hypothetical protein QNJ88_06100 [Acidimicrobiia bacterium]|nr:hypothetical protein [Acidimicrobiia bacterium]
MWKRRRREPSRAELIARKHDLEGQIAGVRADIRRRRNRGLDAADLEAKLSRMRSEHYETRLRIDQTDA